MRKVWAYALFLGVTAGIAGLDQATKAWVRAALPYGATWVPWEHWFPWLRIVHWGNTGVAFGLFPQGGRWFALLAAVILSVLLFSLPRLAQEGPLAVIAGGLIAGGAVGNLVDRLLHHGRVTDFIAVGTFPVFNLADAAISAGAVLYFLWGWFGSPSDAATSPRNPEPTPNPEGEG